MSFSNSRFSIKSKEDILNKVSEAMILAYYLNVYKLPCVISSPLRLDKNPSFYLYLSEDRVKWKDLSTTEHGDLYNLLERLYGIDYFEVLNTIYTDITEIKKGSTTKNTIHTYTRHRKRDIKLQCKIRQWKDYDIEYWKQYGISLKWLQYAEVYPISHKIVVNEGKEYIFNADKFAYAFVEHKEGNTTMKIYQPYNKEGYKWCSGHDSSVLSLWTKIPQTGDKVIICSSLKDALCLWENMSVPCIAVQGEGYNISVTAVSELRKRFNKVYILFDSDIPGITNGDRLSKLTGFTNIVLPPTEKGKDISDIYFYYGKEFLCKMLEPLIMAE